MKRLLSLLLISTSVMTTYGQPPNLEQTTQVPSMVSSLAGTTGFYHPGCLHSQKDFDRIRDDIKNHTHKGVTDTWNIFKDNDKVRQTDFFLATRQATF